MKSYSNELLGCAIAVTVVAIEIYNNVEFLYQSETSCVLAING